MELENWFQRVAFKFRELHGEQSISTSFLQFMQSALKEHFRKELGFNPADMKGKVMISSISKPFTPADGENAMHLLLAVLHYGIEITFSWQSRAGYRTVLPSDTQFDAAQLVTRIDGIDPAEVREYLGIKPQLQHFFNTLDTDYTLEVDQFNSDLVYLIVKSENISQLEHIGKTLDALVQRWNEGQESGHAGSDEGRFHSAGVDRIESNTLIYKMDLGTTSENGLKHLLEELNKHQIDTVRITSFP